MDKYVKPAIVIVAYNRPKSLQRLLKSLRSASYTNDNINLIISIDFQDSDNHKEVVQIAEKFIWSFGYKKLITHKENKGLRSHILSCGDLSLKYGSVIILEDDLIVSPSFYNYALAAVNFYKNEDKIAGISLYSYEYEELGWYRFYPKNLGTDTFFIQWASSWGQLWTNSQWKQFKNWYKKGNSLKTINIPDSVRNWKKSWKKFFIAYLVDTDRYFVYPYNSYTTLIEEGGVHHFINSRQNSVNLNEGLSKKEFHFSCINIDNLKYDVFFQPVKRKMFIKNMEKEIEIEFDFFGTKNKYNFRSDYICSVKKASMILNSFSNSLIPYENNITCNNNGKVLNIAKASDFSKSLNLYEQGEMLYNTRKIYAIKEMALILFYRVVFKIFKR